MLVLMKNLVDVAAKARRLGCRVPVSLALLPGNFSTAVHVDEFCFHAAAPHVRSAWRSVGLEDEGPVLPDRFGGVGPDAPNARMPLSIFFGSRLLGGPAWCLTVALGMVSLVLAFHPCSASPSEIRFDVVVERPNGDCACLKYSGDAYGLVAPANDVRGIWAGSQPKPSPAKGEHRVPARP